MWPLGRRCSQQLAHIKPGTEGNERDVTKEKMRQTDSLMREHPCVTALLMCVSSKDHRSATHYSKFYLMCEFSNTESVHEK